MKSEQLNVFTELRCDHCSKNPGLDPRNPALWFGFRDQDTGEHVCRACSPEHYRKKKVKLYQQLSSEAGMYFSEVPVMSKGGRLARC
jgi:hypothetical protein